LNFAARREPCYLEKVATRDDRVLLDTDDPNMLHGWRYVPAPPDNDPRWFIIDSMSSGKATTSPRWRGDLTEKATCLAGRDLRAFAINKASPPIRAARACGAPTSPLLETDTEVNMSSGFEDLYGSQYLSAADLKKPITAPIEEIYEQDFGRQGERPRIRKVLHLRGVKKSVVLNKTNALNLSEQFGTEFDEWIGKRVTAKAERTSFGGKPTMGVRLYPANGEDSPALKAPKSKSKSDDLNDEIDI
jgi:hypothetical protein